MFGQRERLLERQALAAQRSGEPVETELGPTRFERAVTRQSDRQRLALGIPLEHEAARARCIQVAAEVRGPDVLIGVDDSGPGIPASLTERLFEPFVTSKISGMGLGLSLSRTFLRHQGGDLWNEASRLGGARFVIRLATRATAQTNL